MITLKTATTRFRKEVKYMSTYELKEEITFYTKALGEIWHREKNDDIHQEDNLLFGVAKEVLPVLYKEKGRRDDNLTELVTAYARA